MRALPFILFVGFAIVMVLMLMLKERPLPSGTEGSKPMPAITVTSLENDKPWGMHVLKDQVTLINFYATWCTPCASEMPELVELRKEFPELRFQGIAWNDDTRMLKAWLKKHGNPFHHLWIDDRGEASMALGIRGIPETFVVDGKGIIRYRLSGPLTAEMRKGEFGKVIKTLLDERNHAQ